MQNAGAVTDTRHIDGLSVVIEVPGIYLLTLTSTEAGLRFVPVSIGKSDLINFLPVAGSTVFKVKVTNAPTVLRFRHSDLRASELQPYSIIADAQLIRGRRTSQLWKFTTATRETFKLVTIKSRGDDVEAMLRAAAADELGPCGAFARQHPGIIIGWPEQPSSPWRPERPVGPGTLAVALHLTDETTWSEFDHHLAQMREPFRLLVTSWRQLPDALAGRIRSRFPAVEFFQGGGKGGATAAFLDLLYRGAFEGTDYVCRLSDAPALHRAATPSLMWPRRAGLVALLGGPAQIDAGLGMLRATPEVGVVGPTELRRVTSTAACAEREAELGDALAVLRRRVGLGEGIHQLEHFAGGNFWVRVRALDAIRDLNLSGADFEILSENEAALQAAAIELLFCRSVCQSGYRISDISGAEIGRTPSIGRDVTASPWRDISPLGDIAGRQVCLFASYLPAGRFAESTLHYMRQIKRAGFYLHALAAVPDVTAAVVAPDESAADAFSIRQNEGHDFAIWAAALRRHPELLAAEELLFANDSVFGPIRPFADIVARMRALDADFAAMTESNEIQRHFQSYFLHFKRSAVRSDAFKRFWLNVRSQPNKANLIRSYEVPMLAKLESAGLRGAVLFPSQPGWGKKIQNPVIHAWAELVRAGFPFLKVQLLRDNPGHTDLLGWRTVAAANGYDIGLIEAFFAEHCPGAAALRAGA